MQETLKIFDLVIEEAKKIFQEKLESYGCSWQIFRINSLTDQIFIKANRVRNIQEKKVQKIEDESLKEDFIAILNYSLIGLIQLERQGEGHAPLTTKIALSAYEKQVERAKNLMKNKNHDYDEAWRFMSPDSLTDMILQKIFRLKHIQVNEKNLLNLSQKIQEQYIDIVIYSIFFLIFDQE